jgi:hypothetical protein
MIVITIYGKNTFEISDIVNSLKNKGLQVGKDFDFAFSTGRFDWNERKQIPSQTVFSFYNEKEGTWFALKWM